MICFFVEHIHIMDDGSDNGKSIGVYSTQEEAEAAVERTKLLPGFKDAIDGFVISRCVVDEDRWPFGYGQMR